MIPRYDALTKEQQDEIAVLCKRIKAMAERARREGLLALEDDLDAIPDDIPGKNGIFVQKLIRFVVDGTDSGILAQIADNYIGSSCDSDFDTLSFLLIKQGVLALQAGENPHIVAERFVSCIGLAEEAAFREQTGFSADEW